MTMFGMILSLFAVLFWILRVVISFCANMGIEFGIKPLDSQIELVLLFVTLVCIFFIFKRKMFGALIYLISQWGYYGVYLYKLFNNSQEVGYDYYNILCSFLGVVIPFIIFMDIGFSQSNKKTTMKTKQTNWFYQNEEFDRKYDERADRNQYKF